MNFRVKFSEQDSGFVARFGESNQTFAANMGEIHTIHGKDGEDGKSAYEIAVDNGFVGTEAEWLESLHGKDGKDGQDGTDGYTPQKNIDYFDGKDGKDGLNGKDGVDGKDGYTPVKNVDYFDGKDGQSGKDGKDGKSAYEYAQSGGYAGTESEFNTDLASVSEKDVLIAVQGTTTAQEVMDAIGAGKVVMARSGNTYYLLTNYDRTVIRFSRAYQSTTAHITLNRDTDKWAAGSTTHAKSSHTHTAAQIVFADGETLQEKYDNGKL